MKQEIDVELLSYQETKTLTLNSINFVLHGEGPSGKAEHQVPSNSSDGFHEYRFDWSPDRVSFFTDGQHVRDLLDGVPQTPGRIILNHWSNRDPNWTKGPPVKDVYMTVAYMKAYLNKTSGIQTHSQSDNVCEVLDQHGSVTPGQDTVFLTSDSSSYPSNLQSPAIGNLSTASSLDSHNCTRTGIGSVAPVSPDDSCVGAQGYTSFKSKAGSCCSSRGN